MGVVAVKRHDRAHIVFHRRRYLARRLKLARQIFGMSLHDFAEWTEKYTGQLSKWNLVIAVRRERLGNIQERGHPEPRLFLGKGVPGGVRAEYTAFGTRAPSVGGGVRAGEAILTILQFRQGYFRF
ncbi:hypothetical protein SAMN02745219_01851 [Desulfofundulus thermosubterraneus DSM 16057]|uniref:Uncharacterized protein n=1 Tax=Desulfofundulus thermosubterraneus DSM 16057 TaxID=1121432 RepID=A0A1M6GYL6_9FIRM|nr:hypothetical protein SAMN02745219_01851 [Desulfofundulus thermosubterraneus DSM 16057]